MMYRHTVTVYDRNGNLVKTIPDTVDLAAFGIPGHPGRVEGRARRSRVHARRHARVRLELLDVRRGLRPGGQRRLPASNSYRLELPLPHQHEDARDRRRRSRRQGAEVRRGHPRRPPTCWPPTGAATTSASSTPSATTRSSASRSVPYPRGIAITPDSKTAYIAVMGTHDIARIDLTNFAVSWIRNVGCGTAPPRALTRRRRRSTSTLNGDGKVAKIDPVNGVVQYKVSTGNQPRSMAISADGQSLYVVNYESSDVTQARRERPPHDPDRPRPATIRSASPTTARPARCGWRTTTAASRSSRAPSALDRRSQGARTIVCVRRIVAGPRSSARSAGSGCRAARRSRRSRARSRAGSR